MKPQLLRNTNTITIANFWENFLLKKYDFEPPYQRNSIWSDEKQSFLIDSILRNFPIPPVFLHQRIDDVTGRTTYEVIDGKQRLTSIIRFIENDIPCSSELEDSLGDGEIAGKYFKDFENEPLSDYKKHFWRYPLPIEYIDTANKVLIDHIFDRLNRNGEPLEGQELRNAKYHGSPLLVFIEQKAYTQFWKHRLESVDQARMEHFEFISEAVFVLLERGPLHADQDEIDRMYAKYQSNDALLRSIDRLFGEATEFLDRLNVDYEAFKLRGVSHLYGLWCFAAHCIWARVPADDLSSKLGEFYTALRAKDFENLHVRNYSASMSARTKDRGQRIRRLNALCGYCGVPEFIAS